ncbi:MAG: hypothetical protein CL675_13010 [Bdellovibrionaceae bacterium]|nr:hypothetical protein [Pseudobdellovibrionaceae bacterium]|tara:strand:- start:130 stop:375 length:246 start_codon:yes stop_codon:yes gene_type:complete
MSIVNNLVVVLAITAFAYVATEFEKSEGAGRWKRVSPNGTKVAVPVCQFGSPSLNGFNFQVLEPKPQQPPWFDRSPQDQTI